LLSEDSVAHITASLATEQKEKQKRQLNILYWNLLPQTEHPGRKNNISKCTIFLLKYLGILATINKQCLARNLLTQE